MNPWPVDDEPGVSSLPIGPHVHPLLRQDQHGDEAGLQILQDVPDRQNQHNASILGADGDRCRSALR